MAAGASSWARQSRQAPSSSTHRRGSSLSFPAARPRRRSHRRPRSRGSPPSGVPALDTLLTRLSAPGKAGDLTFQAEGDFTFHRTLVASIGNAVMLDVFDGLHLRQLRVAVWAVALDPARLVLIHAQHAALLVALRRRDAADAVRIVEEHLQPAPEILSRMRS
jgi:DNA-binding GntR family transcriptional regulator